MQDFGENYKASMLMARMEFTLLSGFVDDMKQAGTSVRLGTYYDIEIAKWEWSEKVMWEDEKMRRMGEKRKMKG